MKNIVLIITSIFLLHACSSDGSGDANTLNPVRDIATFEDFTATIVDKQLVFISSDGIRDPAAQLIINSEMKVTGFTQGGEIDFDWYWDNAAFCRSGVSRLPDNPTTEELQCQGVDVDNNVVNFTRDRGEGELASSWFIE